MIYKAPKSQKESGRIGWWTMDDDKFVEIQPLFIVLYYIIYSVTIWTNNSIQLHNLVTVRKIALDLASSSSSSSQLFAVCHL